MERPFDLSIWWEGVDGPLVVRFDDGTHLSAQIEPKRPGAPAPPRWEASVSAGIAQGQIETIVSLAQLAGLPAALSQGDRQVAEAILALLSSLTTTPEPPRSVVREVATWLGHKVDVFIEEAVKTGGKAAGLVGVGGAAIALQKHAPTLAEHIRQLIDSLRRSPPHKRDREIMRKLRGASYPWARLCGESESAGVGVDSAHAYGR